MMETGPFGFRLLFFGHHSPYLSTVPKSPYAPCIPTRGTAVPSHPDWIHEVKHDGFRMIVARDNERVRLYTRGGYDWTKRYPLIVETALRIRSKQFVLDGGPCCSTPAGSATSTA